MFKAQSGYYFLGLYISLIRIINYIVGAIIISFSVIVGIYGEYDAWILLYGAIGFIVGSIVAFINVYASLVFADYLAAHRDMALNTKKD